MERTCYNCIKATPEYKPICLGGFGRFSGVQDDKVEIIECDMFEPNPEKEQYNGKEKELTV